MTQDRRSTPHSERESASHAPRPESTLPNKQVLLGAADELFDARRTGVFGHRVPNSYALKDGVQAHRDMETRTAGPAPILIP
ncbi:MAG: hypothetical protein ABS81_08170 [Pseudonocardia sp. SCN 72-86]|nr:MAG: hypothetical protein ABS81_08170 [Pseudonocardia sp. SCN 72-86]